MHPHQRIPRFAPEEKAPLVNVDAARNEPVEPGDKMIKHLICRSRWPTRRRPVERTHHMAIMVNPLTLVNPRRRMDHLDIARRSSSYDARSH